MIADNVTSALLAALLSIFLAGSRGDILLEKHFSQDLFFYLNLKINLLHQNICVVAPVIDIFICHGLKHAI